jgi:hypothetical protein
MPSPVVGQTTDTEGRADEQALGHRRIELGIEVQHAGAQARGLLAEADFHPGFVQVPARGRFDGVDALVVADVLAADALATEVHHGDIAADARAGEEPVRGPAQSQVQRIRPGRAHVHAARGIGAQITGVARAEVQRRATHGLLRDTGCRQACEQ